MNKQFKIYSVDTKAFYNESEELINKELMGVQALLNCVKEYALYTYLKDKTDKVMSYNFIDFDDYYEQQTRIKPIKGADGKYITNAKANKSVNIKKYMNKLVKSNKSIIKSKEFKALLKINPIVMKYSKHEKGELNIKDAINSQLTTKIKSNSDIRVLNPLKVSKYNLISLFSSDLSRIMKLDANKITTDLLIVRVYHYHVLEQLIDNGYDYLGEHYINLTASAGQIRTKKVLFLV